MKSSTTVALISSLLVARSAAQNPTCYSGVNVIVARASGEAPGLGILKVVSDSILNAIPNSNATAVPYPATITDPLYIESEPNGVGNMTEIIKAYGDACPTNKMVLMGYSQGAHVVGDVLLGNTNQYFPSSPALDEKYLPQIVAVILMGDPTFVPNQTVNAGTSSMAGAFPRPNPDWTQRGLANRTQSYCDTGDFYCASGKGPDAVVIHIGYIGEYGNQSMQYVLGKYNETISQEQNNGGNGGTPTEAGPSEPTGGAERLGAGRAGFVTIGALGMILALTL